eukprot:CAMPEP_0194483376 /NCGR_PEP_ID=MMETSP0253-20130528/5018_1 /TAXON_ID=2966 /ORGANISM="Noctiluca scintillans" /LENGTH=734 /DNA_ID=CAMNT_0039323037 /DNA_START=65 /DNA_END=2269 /DNA_ORIENTATION=-
MSVALRRIAVVTGQVSAGSTASEGTTAEYEVGQHWGVMPDYEHPIHKSEHGVMSMPAFNFSSLLGQAAVNCGDQVALAVERPLPPIEGPGLAPALPWSAWKKWTWAEYHQDARRLAKAFISFGVEHFGSVCIFGFNSPEWMLAANGAIQCGGKYVGIYSTDTPDQTAYKVAHSGAAVIVVDGEVEFGNVASQVDNLPGLNAVVTWGISGQQDLRRSDGTVCRVISFDDCLKFGEAQGDEILAQRLAAQRPGHAIGIIYTSGTTGNPKAVMISSDNVISECALSSQPQIGLLPAYEGGARVLSYLPLSHIAGGLVDLLVPIYFAGHMKKFGTIYFARPYDLKEMTLASRIQFVRPTAFLAVPRVFEKMQARMMAVGASITGVKKSIATWAKGKGLEYARNRQLGGSGAAPFLHGIADKVILSKARDALGLDQCRVFLTGAAPIATETLEYFGTLGMMIQNCYGMSECTGVTTMCRGDMNVFGSVGAQMDGIEVKIFQSGPNGENIEAPPCEVGAPVVPESQQGEICYRGRHIMMGYMANPNFGPDHVAEIEEKNRAAIDKYGWLHSGDKGCMDKNGMYKITGRYKELIIGAGGENIAPVPVEEHLKLCCPALSNVMMVGDNRKYNVILVTLQAEGSTGEFPGGDDLAGAALEVSPGVTKISQAMKDPKWQQYIQAGLDRTNNNPNVCQNNAWKVQFFRIVPRDFSIETGEFTATLKLRRPVAEETWASLIASMFD